VSHEFFPHTGDIGIRVWGGSIEELIRSAALAFTEAVVDPSSVRPVEPRALACRATAPDLLLHDFLGELLFECDARGRLVRDLEVTVGREGEAWTLDATTHGEPIDPSRHHLRMLVKGVTYHALSVTRTPDGWQGTVILDI
jgi:SHS2 domain-containing protein